VASRRLEDLRPNVRAAAVELMTRTSRVLGLELYVTCTLRTPEEQDELYEIGRSKPGKIITNARGGWSWHNYGLAVDFAVLHDGTITWDAPWDRIHDLADEIGFDARIPWDMCHFQMTKGYRLEDLVETLRAHCSKCRGEGVVPCPRCGGGELDDDRDLQLPGKGPAFPEAEAQVT
jgi:peptidoglycan L-alanyl-D-glutamate endopeptidase CwlK